MSYAIAAYAIVIGSLTAYGLWVQSQRKPLLRRDAGDRGGRDRRG